MTCFIRHRETTATFAERREGRKEEKVGRLKSNNSSSPLFSPSAAGLWLPRRMENATLHRRDFPSLPPSDPAVLHISSGLHAGNRQ